jgi:hypothetical protein
LEFVDLQIVLLLIAGELELINLQMDCGGVKVMMFVMISV